MSTALRNILRPIADKLDPGRKRRRAIIEAVERRRYRGLALSTAEEGNRLISARIRDGVPFCAAKYGATESKTYLAHAYHASESRKTSTADELYLHSGFFPKDGHSVASFSELYRSLSREIDLLGIWYQAGERELIEDSGLGGCAMLCDFVGLEPYYFSQPWSHGLSGKKVLVISPFAESIERQFSRKDEIWPQGMLPEFSLSTLKFPHSHALGDNGYSNWFEIYDDFRVRMREADFDVALVGAGAATMPLAVEAKMLGRQGIGLGGSLQILFGIMGRRWETHPFFTKLINDAWVRPAENETPSRAQNVENAAYW